MKSTEEIKGITYEESAKFIADLEAKIKVREAEKKEEDERRVSIVLDSVYEALKNGNVKIEDLYSNSIKHYLEAISSYKALSTYCESCQTHNNNILGLNDKELLKFFHIEAIAVLDENKEVKEDFVDINDAPEADVERFANKIRDNITKEQSKLIVLSELLSKASENIFAPGVKGILSKLVDEYLDHNKLFNLKEKNFGDYSVGSHRVFNKDDDMGKVSEAYNKLLQKYLDVENDPLSAQFEYQLGVTADQLKSLVEHTSKDIKFTEQQLAISSKDLPQQLTSKEQSAVVSETGVKKSKKASGRIMTLEVAEATEKSALASLNYNMNEMSQFMNQSAAVINNVHNALAQLNDLPIKTSKERFSDAMRMDTESLMVELDILLKNGYSLSEFTQQLGKDRLFEVVAKQSMNPDLLTVDKEKFITNYLRLSLGPEKMIQDAEGKNLYENDDSLKQDVDQLKEKLKKDLVIYEQKLANDRVLELEYCKKTLAAIENFRTQGRKANPEIKSSDDITQTNLNKLLDHVKDEHNRKVIDLQEAYIKNLQASLNDPSQKKDLSLYEQYDVRTKTELKMLFEDSNNSLNAMLKNAKRENEDALEAVNKKINIFNRYKNDIKTLQDALEFYKVADIEIHKLKQNADTQEMKDIKRGMRFKAHNGDKSEDEQNKLAAIEVYQKSYKGKLPEGVELLNYDYNKAKTSQNLENLKKQLKQILESHDEAAYETTLKAEKERLEAKEKELTAAQKELKEFTDQLKNEKYSFGVPKQVEFKQEPAKVGVFSRVSSMFASAKKTPMQRGQELETKLAQINSELFEMIKKILEKAQQILSKVSSLEIYRSKPIAIENAGARSHASSLSSSPSTRSLNASLASCESIDKDDPKSQTHASNVSARRSSSPTSGRGK